MDGEAGFANVLGPLSGRARRRTGHPADRRGDRPRRGRRIRRGDRGSTRRARGLDDPGPGAARRGATERRRRADARGRRGDRAHEPVHRLERRPPGGDGRAASATWRCRASGSTRSATTVRSPSTSTGSAATPSGSARRGARPRRYRLTTPAGTDLHGSVEGRPGRVLHGLAREDGAYMAPPDIEAGTAPVESSSEGVVVVDADLLFMGQGPLPSPVVLHVEDGAMVSVEEQYVPRTWFRDRPALRRSPSHRRPRGSPRETATAPAP